MKKNPVLYSDKDFSSRQKVSIKGVISIEKPAAHLWDVITTPGYLKLVHPFCKFHEKVSWDSVGQKDSGAFYSGEKMVRELVHITQGESYTMDVMGKNNGASKIIFTIHKTPVLNKVDFSVFIQSEAFNKMPRPLWKIFMKRKVESNLEVYLSSLLNGIKFYAETGIPVTKNQFGNLKSVSP